MQDLFIIRTQIERERRRRIMILVWAYAYEYEARPLVSDAVFDAECLKVDKTIKTNRPDLDDWFCKEFEPCTGSWVGNFPELEKIIALYQRILGR